MKKRVMTVYTDNDEIAAIIYAFRRKGKNLVVESKTLGVMDMDMVFTPKEIMNGVIMAVSWRMVLTILLLPYYSLRYAIIRLLKGIKSSK